MAQMRMPLWFECPTLVHFHENGHQSILLLQQRRVVHHPPLCLSFRPSVAFPFVGPLLTDVPPTLDLFPCLPTALNILSALVLLSRIYLKDMENDNVEISFLYQRPHILQRRVGASSRPTRSNFHLWFSDGYRPLQKVVRAFQPLHDSEERKSTMGLFMSFLNSSCLSTLPR